MKRSKGITAKELMAQLERDPVFAARRAAEDQERERSTSEYHRAEAPLVRELNAAGASVSSVWDLVSRGTPYSELVPILIAHLNRNYPERVREGIARALAVPSAKVGWDLLIDTFIASKENEVKWAIGWAIGIASDRTDMDQLIRLVSDRRHGRNRAPFVFALARLDEPRARAVLDELADDPDLTQDIRTARKRWR